MRNNSARRIKAAVDAEIGKASDLLRKNDSESAFRHLERAHVLGQAITVEHTRVHWLMLKIGWRKGDFREICGQMLRLVGASTKTAFGIYPTGNTGGTDVWFFETMPIQKDLQKIINEARD